MIEQEKRHGSSETIAWRRCRRAALMTSSALAVWASAAAAQQAPVLPSGGSVVAGNAVIAGAGATLTVTQTSAKAIVNWDAFSIGQGGTVRFDNGSGATLNRVSGGTASQVDGLLTASGSVYLINPNGVVVGKTGVVDTGGSFVAATLDIADKAFMAGGDLRFAGDSRAAVVNYGKIGSLGGDVALIAATVSNAGAIGAANGDVGLLAGRRVVLRDLALDDGKFAVELGGGYTSATNAGTIAAAMAELRANGGNVYALAGNTGSIIDATGVSASDGKVFLVAEGGTLNAGGTITARSANGAGGFIETSGATLATDRLAVDTGTGGRWLLDPATLTIDTSLAGTINTALAGGTSVTQQADTSLTVAALIGWSTGAGLTLSSGGTLSINAPITVSGGGQLTLNYAATNPANLTITAPVEFGATAIDGQALTINGQGYALIRDRSGLEAVNTNQGGAYALATNLDLTGITYTSAVIGGFGGTFDGLGHTIANLTINAPGRTSVGLFGYLAGTIRNIGMIGGTITGYNRVGGLVGQQGGGSITNAYATGAVSGNVEIGGLVGEQVSGSVIANVHATGAVSGSYDVGGLVGLAVGSIASAYATGAVSGLGGNAGGLVGADAGSIVNAYATGAVSGASYTGGLVGAQQGGSIANAYATGAVSGAAAVGGLVGYQDHSSIANTYATGAVTSGGSSVGGLVGYQDGGSIAGSFWDTTTTGRSVGVSGGTGVTTAQLASAATLATLNGGGAMWGNADNQTTPYLLTNAGLVYLGKGGSATPTAYQAIVSAAGLQAVNANANGNYVLANNLDLTGVTYTGSVIGGFGGIFDGLGHTIANLTINAPEQYYVGLFGQSSGTIRNIGLIGGSIAGGYTGVGALVGYLHDGAIANAYASSTVSGTYYIGGLVGQQSGGSITNSYATGTVSGTSSVGGLVGLKIYGSITNAYATGTVSGDDEVGGLAGGQDGSITNAYATGAVSGGREVGGLVGAGSGPVLNSFWDATRTGQGASAGGTGLTTAQLHSLATFTAAGWSVVGQGGTASVWRIYDGQSAPLLRSFLTPLDLSGIASTATYDGQSHTAAVAATLLGVGATGVHAGSYQSTYYSSQQGYDLIGQASLTITPATVTASLIGTTSKTYDAMLGAALTTANFTLSGVVGTDAVSLATPTTGNFSDYHAGTGKTVSAGGLGLTNNGFGDYKLAATAISGAIGTITPAILTATLVGNTSKTYDATTTAALTAANFKLAGVVGQDNVALATPATGTYDTIHAGVGKTVSAGGLALTGNNFGDYTLASTTTSAAIGTINAATLTATLLGTTSKTYDATTTAALTAANFKLSGVVGTDTIALATPGAGTYDTVHAGTGKTVSAAGLGLTNNGYGDYKLAATTASAAIGTITPATLSASLVGSTSKTYDTTTAAALTAANFRLSGVVGTDTVALATPGAGTYDTIHAGTGKTVSAAGLALANNGYGDYKLAATTASAAIGTITPATLTASLVGSTSRTYNATTAAALTAANFKLAGVIGTDTVALATPGAGTYDTVHAGTGKTVSAAGLGLTNNSYGDYKLAATTASAAIGTITPATLTASLVGSTSKTYDGTTTAALTAANFTLSGVIGTDTVKLATPATGSFADANAGTGKTVSATGLALTGNSYGDYTLGSSTVAGAIGRIDPRAVTASLTGNVNKAYDGTTAATLSSGNFSLTGVLGSDAVSVATTGGTYATANVAYAIPVTVTGLTLGGAAARNYTLTTTSLSAAIGLISPFIIRTTLCDLPADLLRWAQLNLASPGNYGLTLTSPGGDIAIIAPPINKYGSR